MQLGFAWPSSALAAGPANAAAAGAAAAADSIAAAAFLRGIRPALTCLDAALAALPHSGITMAVLRRASLASKHASPAARKARINFVAAGLDISEWRDKVALDVALEQLRSSIQAGAAAAGPPADASHSIAAFLRGIWPPLTCLNTALAAVRPGDSLELALLSLEGSAEAREARINMIAEGLRITLPGDKLMLDIALDELAGRA